MYPILSQIRVQNSVIYWEVEEKTYDFSLSEFEDLLKALVQGKKLFSYLENFRPVLRDNLLRHFQKEIEEEILGEDDLENILESSLLASKAQFESDKKKL